MTHATPSPSRDSHAVRGALALALLLAGCAGGALASRTTPVPYPRARAAPDADAALERVVLAELNRLRADPRGYAATVEALLPHFEGKVLRRPGERLGIVTSEGAAAVREAAAALRAARPAPPLRASEGLARAARDHVRDQGPRGALGHDGTDGSSVAERAARHGRWLSRLTENIDYGRGTGRDVVIALVVDDGVPGRGHRRNVLDPAVTRAGVGCGPHAVYGRMCVIVQAAGYEERR